jgi:opacity protein-like surface antigen
VSVGGGFYLTGDFGGGYGAAYLGSYTISNPNPFNPYPMPMYGDITETLKTPYFGGGGFLFLDVTYAELSFGLFGGSGTKTTETTTPNGTQNETKDYSVTGLDFGLLVKYPIALNSSLSIFPLFGINYRVIVAAKTTSAWEEAVEENNPSGLSALWFKFGGGVDYAITSNVYLRGNFLYGIRLPNENEFGTVNAYNKKYSWNTAETHVGHGLDVKIAVGYKF